MDRTTCLWLRVCVMNYLVWKNKVILTKKNKDTVITREITKSREDWKIFHHNQSSQQLTFFRGKCIVLAIKCILNFTSGVQLPHALIAAGNQPSSSNITLEILVCKHKSIMVLKNCGLQFKIPKEVFHSCEDMTYHLLDGPTVLWHQGTFVHIVHGQGLNHVSVGVHTLAPNLRLKKIRRLWCQMCYEGEVQSPCILIFVQVLLQCRIPTREFGDREWLSAKIPLQEGGGISAVRVADSIPQSYGCVITCVTSHKSYCVDQCSGTLLEKESHLVGTELQQVVILEDGASKHVLSLDFIPHQLVSMTVSQVVWYNGPAWNHFGLV